MRLRDCRSGFTRTDLIVVLVILGILSALAVVGIQKLRRSASQHDCLLNIGIIALTCHTCNDVLGSMPPYHAGDGKGLPKDSLFARRGNNGSLLYFVLPFLEGGSPWRLSRAGRNSVQCSHESQFARVPRQIQSIDCHRHSHGSAHTAIRGSVRGSNISMSC
jgi:hypothetical protein